PRRRTLSRAAESPISPRKAAFAGVGTAQGSVRGGWGLHGRGGSRTTQRSRGWEDARRGAPSRRWQGHTSTTRYCYLLVPSATMYRQSTTVSSPVGSNEHGPGPHVRDGPTRTGRAHTYGTAPQTRPPADTGRPHRA